MDLKVLPFRSAIEKYEAQAEQLLAASMAGDAETILVGEGHAPADAQRALARWYDYRDWAALAEYTAAVADADSPAGQFETAVEAVVAGDVAGLQPMLREHPDLVEARSTRVTRMEPPVHRATLVHYIAANGVEGYRQKTPANAVDVAELLLRAGAAVDALADMYGSQVTTMSMLVSSEPPARAGVQAALVETLLDFGAAIEGSGAGPWRAPLMTALAFGYGGAAQTLARRGARVDHVAAAAGLGRLAAARRFLPGASAAERHRALALAAQHGHMDIVRLLLDAGEDPSRYNPEGNHGHSTPLHQAALAGHEEVVRLLVERGARLDVKDTIYQGTPLGWAIYGKQAAIEENLRGQGART